MRSNASISALFLLLAGCAGHGYSDLPEVSAAPAAGARDLGQDPYAAPEPGDPYAQQAPYQQPDPYAGPQPRDPYASPGASYGRPDEAVAAPAGYNNDPGAGMPGPRGSSLPAQGERRYDEVGYAGVRSVAGGEANGGAIVAVARAIPPGSFVEVTSLETGRTILLLVTGSMDPSADHPIDLSSAAARQLGASGSSIPVRVRTANASPPDQAALRSGQPAGERPDTPPVLLNALRKHLPGGAPVASYGPAPRPSATGYRPPTPSRPASARDYYVQVGAFANAANARALAQSLGGFVRPGGGLNRVQLGPFANPGQAEAARANVARSGYPDARVFTQN